jgi:hypothetical protein
MRGKEMSYLHCHNCDWEQDDFYSIDGYNPAKSLADWNEILCGERLSERMNGDGKTFREAIAQDYEKFARRIRNMKWVTWEQWKAEPIKVCPKCGSRNLDID